MNIKWYIGRLLYFICKFEEIDSKTNWQRTCLFTELKNI